MSDVPPDFRCPLSFQQLNDKNNSNKNMQLCANLAVKMANSEVSCLSDVYSFIKLKLYYLICLFSLYSPKILLTKLRSCTLHVFKRGSVKPLCCAGKPVVSKLTLAVQREALRRGPSRTSIKSQPLDCRGKSDLQQLQQIVTLQSTHKEVDV